MPTHLIVGRWPYAAYAMLMLSVVFSAVLMPTHTYYDIFVYQDMGLLLRSDFISTLNPFSTENVQPYPILMAPILLWLSFVPSSLAIYAYIGLVTVPATFVVVTVIHRIGRYGHLAAYMFVAGTFIMGSTYWARLEPIVAVLFTLGLAAAIRRRSGAALGWTALAAAAKLMPVTGFLAFPAPERRPRLGMAMILAAFGLVLMALDVVRVLAITFGRQIQVESVLALPALFARSLGDERFGAVYLGRLPDMSAVAFGPSEVMSTLGLLGIGATLLGLSFTVWRLLVAYLHAVPSAEGFWLRMTQGSRVVAPEVQMAAVLAATAAILIGGKVLSPQFMAILLIPAALHFALTGRYTLITWTLVTSVLSFVVWPFFYQSLGTTAWFPVLALTARAVALLATFVVAVRAIHYREVAVGCPQGTQDDERSAPTLTGQQSPR